MPSPFHLSCLGEPQLCDGAGEAIRFRTRKHFALLIRLALEPGHAFSRDSLTELLWPDVPPKRARHSLAQGVSVLRAKLGRENLLVRTASSEVVSRSCSSCAWRSTVAKSAMRRAASMWRVSASRTFGIKSAVH